MPLTNRSVNRVIDEYVTLRERQQTQGRTSFHMLRQIKRVVKFWREYIGDQSIESVGNKELSGYIEWRKSYYAQFKTLPKNAKLNPTSSVPTLIEQSQLVAQNGLGYEDRLQRK